MKKVYANERLVSCTTLTSRARFVGNFLFAASGAWILTNDSDTILFTLYAGNAVDSQQAKERAARARSSKAEVRDCAYPVVYNRSIGFQSLSCVVCARVQQHELEEERAFKNSPAFEEWLNRVGSCWTGSPV